ncbi:hypothetical protein NC661_00730 [Aquibacillus koreensis]|uniref:Cobalamin biosynthesis protein CbiN n=1 Tax=Aquibacillus koreensis TaxID=279446 RepID=A0A9X3WKD8_9BACI|nr:hypothetical protein [Aquibacillus koreensis]MCT2537463.1 hypothetical protein [Aquibacillus koreensis]MDC3418909.1 hypothetical protein [Aquibacillus koreensis]
MKKIVFITCFLFIITSVLSFIIPNKAYACSCIDDSVEENYQDSSVVFTGTLVSKDTEGGNKFQVDKVWKGELQDGYVYSGFFGMCGTEFEKGSKYLVYTYNHDGTEETSLCSDNKLISEASADINKLDQLIETDKGSFFPYVLVLILTITIIIVIWRIKWSRS